MLHFVCSSIQTWQLNSCYSGCKTRITQTFHSDPFRATCWLPEETFALCSAAASILLVKAGQPQWQDTKHHTRVQILLGGRWAPQCRWDPWCSSSTGLCGLSFIHHQADTFLLSAWGLHTQQAVVLPHSAMWSNWQPCSLQTLSPFCLLARGEQHWDSMSVVFQEIDAVTFLKFTEISTDAQIEKLASWWIKAMYTFTDYFYNLMQSNKATLPWILLLQGYIFSVLKLKRSKRW